MLTNSGLGGVQVRPYIIIIKFCRTFSSLYFSSSSTSINPSGGTSSSAYLPIIRVIPKFNIRLEAFAILISVCSGFKTCASPLSPMDSATGAESVKHLDERPQEDRSSFIFFPIETCLQLYQIAEQPRINRR
jgi:hypothetical protein